MYQTSRYRFRPIENGRLPRKPCDWSKAGATARSGGGRGVSRPVAGYVGRRADVLKLRRTEGDNLNVDLNYDCIFLLDTAISPSPAAATTGVRPAC
jgi:hypothetical protein